MSNARWALLAGLLLVAVAPLLPAAGQQVAFAVLASAASVTAVRRARRDPARPAAWWLLGAATATGAVCSAAWALAFAAGTPPAGFSVIDAAYVGMYLLVGTALLMLAAGRGPRLAGVVEAGVVVCTAMLLGWFALYDPLIHEAGTWHGMTGAMVYPLLDLFLVFAVVRLVAVVGRLTVKHVFLLLAVASVTVADVSYFTSVFRGEGWHGPAISAAGWSLFHLMLSAAAGYPSPPDTGQGRIVPSRGVAALYVTLVVINPAVTAVAFLLDLSEREFAPIDVMLPMTITSVVGMLLVLRLNHTQQRLARLALRDELTGLPNRVQLELWLARARRGSLLVLDLDDFKHVNDSLGHTAGDALLVTVAGRLRAVVHGHGQLARLGGDEFAILADPADRPAGGGPAASDPPRRRPVRGRAAENGRVGGRTTGNGPVGGHAAGNGPVGDGAVDAAGGGRADAPVTALADRVRAALREPVDVAGHRLHLTVSIGVRRLDHSPGALGDADLALYAAKAAGKDRAVVYEAALRETRLRRLAIVERLRTALLTDEITVHYQPIVTLRTGRVDAVEALVRWQALPPDAFIPAAEDSGLIVPLGEQVLRAACRAAAPWHARHGTSVTVNVSPRQLREPDFAVTVRRALLDSGLPATALILEITEGVLVGSALTTAHLNELRQDGVRVAVDDFGTGYSSLAYLRDLPIDILKIDRSFLRPGPASEPMIRAVVDLAHSLGLVTVTEGVETAEQAAVLVALGCDRGQGWHFGRPSPAEQVTALLETGTGARLIDREAP
ncbi:MULTISPECIES: putative bifunctional diguanylate cyclase/phosphodiesterase [Catenuloplanes]|uniref:Signal transduction protein with EAL and GGDEF domain n=1 Tax=Catenuloplanes niger TaxID=587534 RepID=A0AAE3ZKJ9_9ACTN|nr:bifunctional diguanylate cyclase/phosphodiesterase [Catenuloplanes niger]MDR7320364.1 putative signal transduction protein with EAL and GGDEF domain [Catenuloplanes niger]